VGSVAPRPTLNVEEHDMDGPGRSLRSRQHRSPCHCGAQILLHDKAVVLEQDIKSLLKYKSDVAVRLKCLWTHTYECSAEILCRCLICDYKMSQLQSIKNWINWSGLHNNRNTIWDSAFIYALCYRIQRTRTTVYKSELLNNIHSLPGLYTCSDFVRGEWNAYPHRAMKARYTLVLIIKTVNISITNYYSQPS
jgi:hypothetical protein